MSDTVTLKQDEYAEVYTRNARTPTKLLLGRKGMEVTKDRAAEIKAMAKSPVASIGSGPERDGDVDTKRQARGPSVTGTVSDRDLGMAMGAPTSPESPAHAVLAEQGEQAAKEQAKSK